MRFPEQVACLTKNACEPICWEIRTTRDLIDGRIGQIQLYNEMLKRYEDRLAAAKTQFEQDQLNRIWSDVREKDRDLAGPLLAMDKELQEDAMKLLEVSQLVDEARLAPPLSPIRIVDLLTIAGLAGLGILLIIGLFTRFAAFSAAFMVLGFYLAMPPFPGVPEAPGPEHSFIVNKNLIEVFALLALSSVPTGYWFGVDKLVAGFFAKKKLAKAAALSEMTGTVTAESGFSQLETNIRCVQH
jgi:uncharacterized membrane protein YphA (DoxX/SURF4 family)